MENAHTPSDPSASDIARPNPLMARLWQAAESLLAAFEAAPIPKDHAGIGKAARTLISLTRLIKAVFDDGTARSTKRKAGPIWETTGDRADLQSLEDTLTEALAQVEAQTPQVPAPPLNRQQRRREEKLKRKAEPMERYAREAYPQMAQIYTDGACRV